MWSRLAKTRKHENLIGGPSTRLFHIRTQLEPRQIIASPTWNHLHCRQATRHGTPRSFGTGKDMIVNTKLTRRLRRSSRCVPSPLLVRHRRRPAKRKPTSGSIQLKPANKNALILHKLRNYKDGHCNRSATCTPAADNRLRLGPVRKKGTKPESHGKCG